MFKALLKFLNIVLILFSLLVMAYLAFSKLSERVYWSLEEKIVSPDNSFVAYIYHNNSDHDRHAPYGIYVFLKESNNLNFTTKGDLIFAGYCSDSGLVKWDNQRTISISCKTKENSPIQTLASKIYGIDVRLTNNM